MDPAPARGPRRLPEGTILLHVGPPKTATTQLQAALWAARPALGAQGVRHAGRSRHPASAVHAVLGRGGGISGAVPPIRRWRELVREIRGAREPRVILSSEFLADADPEAIRRIVADLGRERVHVALTLRPLARILPSQWQQYVLDGISTGFDPWLEGMFRRPPGRMTPGFWRRHGHDGLVARWAEAVGPERVTVVALGDGDPEGVLRTFEALLGLDPGLLRAQQDLANRSLTLPEIEAVRAFNAMYHQAKLPKPLLRRVVHFGAGRYLRRLEADPAAPRISLPAWVLDEVAAAARRIVDGIAGSGVHVVGDLERLAEVPRPPAGPGERSSEDAAPAAGADPSVGAALALAMLVATGQARDGRTGPPSQGVEGGALAGGASDDGLAMVPTYVLAGVIYSRLREAAGRRGRALLSRLGSAVRAR